MNYLWEAGRTHPFEFFSLLFALCAVFVSIRALQHNKRQADAASIQADEARRAREVSETALQAQAEALKAQSEEGKVLARTAQRSADAAEESAKATKALAETGQRAWIVVKKLDRARHQQLSTPIAAIITIANVGRTPAKDLSFFQRWELSDNLRTEDLSLNILKAGGSRGGLGPGIEFQHKTQIDLSAEEARKVVDESMFLFVYGIATYVDVFNVERYTRWSFIYVPSDQDFTLATTHNDFD